MKSVIANHRELQVNLFYAITAGLEFYPLPPNLHVVPEVTETSLLWKIMKYPTRESCAVDGEVVFEFTIYRGYSQVNDVRLGVIVSYLRSQAQEFLSQAGSVIGVQSKAA